MVSFLTIVLSSTCSKLNKMRQGAVSCDSGMLSHLFSMLSKPVSKDKNRFNTSSPQLPTLPVMPGLRVCCVQPFASTS